MAGKRRRRGRKASQFNSISYQFFGTTQQASKLITAADLGWNPVRTFRVLSIFVEIAVRGTDDPVVCQVSLFDVGSANKNEVLVVSKPQIASASQHAKLSARVPRVTDFGTASNANIGVAQLNFWNFVSGTKVIYTGTCTVQKQKTKVAHQVSKDPAFGTDCDDLVVFGDEFSDLE